jgi:hypothetical protein
MKTEVGRKFGINRDILIKCLASKTVYRYGSIDTNFAPLQFSLDSTFNLAVNISRFTVLKWFCILKPGAKFDEKYIPYLSRYLAYGNHLRSVLYL